MRRSQSLTLRESFTFTRLSMLIGPIYVLINREMVEPPGIAPGSSSLITWAFIPIVRPKPDLINIGGITAEGKRNRQKIIIGALINSLRADA